MAQALCAIQNESIKATFHQISSVHNTLTIKKRNFSACHFMEEKERQRQRERERDIHL